jgi:general stress protein 26
MLRPVYKDLQAEGQYRTFTAVLASSLLEEWSTPMRTYVPRNIRQLRRLLKGMPVGMLTTLTSGGTTHTRPMMVHDIDDGGWLWFLTDRHSRKAWELIHNPQATITFQSPKGDRFVSVQGTAVVIRDDVKLQKLWKPSFRAWFPQGKEAPEIVLVAVRVARAEYWLVPRWRLARLIGATAAVITGKPAEPGRHGILDLHPAPTPLMSQPAKA